MKNIVFSVLTVTLHFVFFLLTLYYYSCLFSKVHSYKTIWCVVFSAVNIAVLTALSFTDCNIPIIFSITFIILFLECIIIYKGNIFVPYWYAISLVFILSVARGIVSSLLSLATHRSIYTMSHTAEYLIVCMFLSGIFALITIFLSAKCIYTMHKLRTLISCRSQFKIVCIMQTISMLYLLLLSFSYLFAVELMSLSLFQLLSCISVSLTNGILIYFVINFSLQIEQTLKAEIIGTQLDRQLRHYDAYQKHVESFRVFKRNYNITTGTVRLKIQDEDYRGAIELLDQADIHMQTLSSTHKEYCNHPLLDAILQDCANSCGAKDIEFTSMIYIPKGILLSDLDYCRIFSNLCANALEACAVIKDNTPKYIHFTSCVCNGYLIITCENPYSGTIRFKDDLPITIKENKEEHGIGLSIVKKLAEDSGGFVSIKTDAGVFKISLHLKIENIL